MIAGTVQRSWPRACFPACRVGTKHSSPAYSGVLPQGKHQAVRRCQSSLVTPSGTLNIGGSDLKGKGKPSGLPNELLHIIHTHIKTHGPLALPRYISLCLSHPTLGYYTRAERRGVNEDAVIGRKGDFVTSPEISQVFGELLAIWYITQWQAQGMSPKTRLVELGPGRGTLMDDMIRTFRSISAFSQTLTDVHLVETSLYMRKLQESRLGYWREKGINIHWHDRIQDVPSLEDDTFTMIAAHEFFDALPIYKFEKRPEGWREVYVDVDMAASNLVSGSGEKVKPKLRLVVSPAATAAANFLIRKDDPVYSKMEGGAKVEICGDAFEIAQAASQLIGKKKKGAGLVVDYGDERIFGSSFRAFKQHRIVDPLDDPGSADLTTNVNFDFIREALYTPPLPVGEIPADGPPTSSVFSPPILSQRSFLLSLGLQTRVEKLLQCAMDDKRREDIIKSAERLVEKSEKLHGMGKIFKVLAFVPKTDQDKQEVFPFGAELD